MVKSLYNHKKFMTQHCTVQFLVRLKFDYYIRVWTACKEKNMKILAE